MSHPIQPGAVLSEVFSFPVQRWGTIARLSFLPLILTVVLILGTISQLFDFDKMGDMAEIKSMSDFNAVMKYNAFITTMAFIALWFVAIFLYSGYAASIMRLIVLGEERRGWLYLRADDVAYRVFLASLIATVLYVGIFLIVMMFAFGMSGSKIGDLLAASSAEFTNGSSQSHDALSSSDLSKAITHFLPAMLGGIFVYSIISGYLAVRLVPFLAATAATNRVAFLKSFDLTKGHFWSLVGVMFMAMLAMFLIGMAYQIVASIFSTMAELGDTPFLGWIAVIAMIFQLALVAVYQIYTIGVQLALPAVLYRNLQTGS